MWKDYGNNIAEYAFKHIGLSEFAPYICPECNQNSAHIYMQVYDLNTRRGGLWIWCSNCHSFLHSSHYIPLNWVNYEHIETEKLSAVPIYLEELKAEIDMHVNMHIKQKLL